MAKKVAKANKAAKRDVVQGKLLTRASAKLNPSAKPNDGMIDQFIAATNHHCKAKRIEHDVKVFFNSANLLVAFGLIEARSLEELRESMVPILRMAIDRMKRETI